MLQRLITLLLTLLLWPAPPAAASEQWQVLYTRSTPASGAVVDLRAVGDLMLGRKVAAVAEERGWQRVFAPVAAQSQADLLGGDLALGNLESPLSTQDADPRTPLQLVGPLEAAPALAAAGFDLLSLANNHSYDAGVAGLPATKAALERAGVGLAGVGKTTAAAYTPAWQNLHGVTLAVLAASDLPGASDPPQNAGSWQRARLDDRLFTAVGVAARSADLVVVLVHWGEEYAPQPNQRQQRLAEQLVAAGADLIIGAHPHVVQPYAIIETAGRRGLVLYSLGNFLFDQLTRWDTSTGAVARILLDRNGVVELRAVPVDLVGWQIRPLPIDSLEGQQVLHALGAPTIPAAPPAPHPSLQAWDWQGYRAQPLAVPRRANPIVHPETLYVDLRGDGEQQIVRLVGERVRVHNGPDERDPLVWDSQVYGWPITRITSGDADNDGRQEVVMLVHKPDRAGKVRVHPFLLGYRGGAYKIIWGGSPRAAELRDIAVGDLNGDHRNELIMLEGPANLARPATTMVVLAWDAWFFYEEARLTKGAWYQIDLRDVDRNGQLDLLADTQTPTQGGGRRTEDGGRRAEGGGRRAEKSGCLRIEDRG